MSKRDSNEKILFGLKVRYLRQDMGLSFNELSGSSGLSVSYLNEIEKGKKFPKEDKLKSLAKALGITVEKLKGRFVPSNLQPVAELLRSNFLNELPLDLFGIELSKVTEIIANAPSRVGAFIAALVDISKNYSIQEEHFYLGAMRAFQEMHFNYFEDIENALDEFKKKVKHNSVKVELDFLIDQLTQLGVQISENTFTDLDLLGQFRSVYNPSKKILHLRPNLSDSQKKYQLAKEIGFNVLNLNPRPLTSTVYQVRNFEEVLNNFKAGYFSVGLLVDREEMIQDLEQVFSRDNWSPNYILALFNKYAVNPEIVFQRFNVLPKFFGIQNVFFHRFILNKESDTISLDKEYHFRKRHYSQIDDQTEHYCRRWSSVNMMDTASEDEDQSYYLRSQRSYFVDTKEEYITVTATQRRTDNVVISNTIGMLIDKNSAQSIKFLKDKNLEKKEVSLTCQRCSIQGCEERKSPPLILDQMDRQRKVQRRINALINE